MGTAMGPGAGRMDSFHVRGSPSCLSNNRVEATKMVCKAESTFRKHTEHYQNTKVSNRHVKYLNAFTPITNFVYCPAFKQLFLCYCKVVPKQCEFDATVNSSTSTPIYNPFSNIMPQITCRISTLYEIKPVFGSKEVVQTS